MHASPPGLPRPEDPLPLSEVKSVSALSEVELAEHEDLGSSVPRPSQNLVTTEIQTSPPTLVPFCRQDEVDPVSTNTDDDFLHVVLSAEPIGTSFLNYRIQFQPSSSVRTIVERKMPTTQPQVSSSVASRTKRPGLENPGSQKKPRKKKKPRDEIDDIFG